MLASMRSQQGYELSHHEGRRDRPDEAPATWRMLACVPYGAKSGRRDGRLEDEKHGKASPVGEAPFFGLIGGVRTRRTISR